MTNQELKDIKSLALNYSDPIRGKLLALVAYIEKQQEEIEMLKDIIASQDE